MIATPDVGMRVVKTGEAYEVRNFVREIKSSERSEFIRYYDYLAIGQHLLMSNLNNNDLTDLLVRWFEENGLILKGNAL